jgi:hypothetical protein
MDLKAETDGSVLLDSNNQLKTWQIDAALEHWRIIRNVLAEEVWINY